MFVGFAAAASAAGGVWQAIYIKHSTVRGW